MEKIIRLSVLNILKKLENLEEDFFSLYVNKITDKPDKIVDKDVEISEHITFSTIKIHIREIEEIIKAILEVSE